MKHLLYSISSIFNSLEINEKRLDLEYRIKMWEYKKNTKGGEEEKNCFLKFENERDFLDLRPIRSLQNMIVSDKSFC